MKNMSNRTIESLAGLVGSVLLLLFPALLCADTIILDNGHELSGRITLERDNSYQIETMHGTVTIEKSRVEHVIRDSPETNELLKAEMLIDAGEWGNGFARYLNLLEDTSTSRGLVAQSILKHRNNILMAIPAFSFQAKNRLGTLIEMLISQIGEEDREFYFFAGQVFSNLDEHGKAFELFTALPRDFYRQYPRHQEFVNLVFQKIIDDLLENKDFSAALERIENITYLDESLGKSFQILLYLHWGATNRSAGDYEKALNIYIDNLMPLSPAIALNRINLILNDLVIEEKRNHAYEKIMRFLELYSRPYLPTTYNSMMIDVLRDYGNYLRTQGEYREAVQVFERYYDLLSPEIDRVLISLVHYEERLSKIEDSDYEGHYDLGKYCMEHNLYEQAIAEFNKAAESDTFKENAALQIKLIKDRMEMALFNEAMDFYEKERFVEALDVLQQLRQEFPRGSMSSEVEKLVRLCEDGLKNELWRRPYQAEVYYQQAERFFFMSNYKESLEKIQTVISLYSDTPAAEKAQDLRKQIIQMIQLANLEGRSIILDISDLKPETPPSDTSRLLEKEIKSLLADVDNL